MVFEKQIAKWNGRSFEIRRSFEAEWQVVELVLAPLSLGMPKICSIVTPSSPNVESLSELITPVGAALAAALAADGEVVSGEGTVFGAAGSDASGSFIAGGRVAIRGPSRETIGADCPVAGKLPDSMLTGPDGAFSADCSGWLAVESLSCDDGFSFFGV